MANLFLSYAQPDMQRAALIRQELLTASFSVFWDADIPFSEDWMETINTAVRGADHIIVLLSEAAIRTRTVTGVIEFAHHLDKPILVLFTGDFLSLQVNLPDSLLFLADQTWIDAADTPAWMSILLADADDFGSSVDRSIPEDLWELEADGPGDDQKPGTSRPEVPALSVSTPQPSPAMPPAVQTTPDETTERRKEASPDVEPARFAVYAPKETRPNVWQPVSAYVYRESAASQVQADAAQLLGATLGDYRQTGAPSATSLPEGALVTATPFADGIQFNPPSASVLFYDQWQRIDFRARAVSAAPDLAANGRITFTVDGVIVAEVPISIYVSDMVAASSPPVTSPSAYQTIFCSYSHKDTAIVERVERVARLMGLTYLRDVTTLRAGEHWSTVLIAMIDRADIFQLFWSANSAGSKYVRQEWEHALKQLDHKPAFIRPVYWQQPLPPPPAELSSIHFAFDPTLAST